MEPWIHPPGGGEALTDRPERWVTARLEHELMDITESRYSPGVRGPDPHIHRQHADAFYVLDGELVFGLGPEGATRVRGTTGTFALVPAGVIHTFGNESDADARFLNIHAPGMGFIESLRARRDGRHEDADRFDQWDPPENGGRSIDDAVVRGPGEGETAALGTTHALYKAGRDDGDSTLAVAEATTAPGFAGMAPHLHERHVDALFVLEGTYALRVGDEHFELVRGSFAAMLPGQIHASANPGSEEARVLSMLAPAGLEQYLREVAASTPPGEPPDPEKMAAIATRYDVVPQ